MTLLTDLFPGGGGGLSNIVEDTTPQLGGNLDMNGHNIGGNTETQIDDAVTKKHAANADTALGAQTENLNMNTHKIVGVVDPVGAQDVATKAYGDANWAGGGGTVSTSGTPVDNDFAKFTDALTIEGRSYSETRTDLGLNTGSDVAFNRLTLSSNYPLAFNESDVWFRLGGDTEAHCMLRLKDGTTHPGAVWNTTDSRAIEIVGLAPSASYPFAHTSMFLSSKWWNGSSVEQKTLELENKIRNDGSMEFWMEMPAGHPIFRITKNASDHAQFKTHDQPNSEIEFWANQGAGADNYVEMATLNGTGFNILAGTWSGSSVSISAQAENLNMNTHKIVGVVDPADAQDVATKAYGDANWAGGGGTVSTSGTPVDNDFAKFTDALTIEGRSYSETRTDLGLVIGTNVQAYDADLTTLGGLAKTNSNFIVGNGSTWVTESAATARASLGLGSAAIRNAEDTMTDGGNLPDGHAIKVYGDANWAGSGSSDKISEGDSSVEVIDTGNGHIRFTEDGVEIARFADATLRMVGINPGLWLDETGTGNKGAYLVLDDKLFQIQRRAQNFGAHEASPFTLDIATGQTNIVGALHMNTHKITGVVDPTANQEVATKKYVDDNAGGVSDIAYASSWNGVTGTAPSKNAIWDWTKPYTITVNSRPDPLGNHDGIAGAFSGDISKIQFPVKHYILGAATLGQPTTGYLYTPEAYPHYTYLYSDSGWNQSLTADSGRTATVAYKTTVFQNGLGDGVCFNGGVYVVGLKPGATSWLANAAGAIINGDVTAGANGVHLNTLELNALGGAYDVACNSAVFNMYRNVNTASLGEWWNAVRVQSRGTKAIESALHLNGKALWGIDFTKATFTNSAMALKSGQKIEFNATAGTHNASADGGKYIKYDGSYLCSSTHFQVNGQLRCNNFRIDHTATAEVNTSATHYVGIEVNGVTYKVLLKSV